MKRKDRRIMLEEEEEREEEGWMRGMTRRGVRGKDAERGEEGGLFWLLGGSRECE